MKMCCQFLGGKFFDRVLSRFGIARRQYDFRAAYSELPAGLEADAAIPAGHNDNRFV
jgi:hypothetical protein